MDFGRLVSKRKEKKRKDKRNLFNSIPNNLGCFKNISIDK